MPLPLRGTGGFNSTEDKGTYDRALLRRSQPKLVHNNYGVKARIPARGGTWVEWRRMEKLSTTTTALTEGTITTETIPTITSVVATVAQYGQFFRSTDLVADQAFDPIIAEATEVLGEAMGESLDILNDTNVVNAFLYAAARGDNNPLATGRLGNYLGAEFIVTSQARIFASLG